ncbi:hypothetical protein HDV00_004454 [Rhizophlyctis rosea]|nr:hypothetical protein HDV00_004454 [Rhizophlyctis rosea]
MSETAADSTVPYMIPQLDPIAREAEPTPLRTSRARSVWFSALDLNRAETAPARAAEVDAVDNEAQVQQRARAAFFDEHGAANMRKAWYPVALKTDFPPGPSIAPKAVQLLGDPIVLYRDAEGVLVALEDKCAHRSMPLSAGRIINGQLECRYDGWRYNSEGAVTHIPALLPDRKIPHNAYAKRYPTIEKDDLIWVWPGDPTLPAYENAYRVPPSLLPGASMLTRQRTATAQAHDGTLDEEDGEGQWGKTFTQVFDLDVDHSVVLENMLDVAHIPFTHEGGISCREDATPLHVEISFAPGGSALLGRVKRPLTTLPPLHFKFIPPCHIQYSTDIREDYGWKFQQEDRQSGASIQADLLPRYYQEWRKKALKDDPYFKGWSIEDIDDLRDSYGPPPCETCTSLLERDDRTGQIRFLGPAAPRYTLANLAFIRKDQPSQVGIVQAATAASNTQQAMIAASSGSRRSSMVFGGSRRSSMIVPPFINGTGSSGNSTIFSGSAVGGNEA